MSEPNQPAMPAFASLRDLLDGLNPMGVPRPMPRLMGLTAAPRVPVESLVESLYAILDTVEGWDDERLEEHRDRLEAAEEDLLGLIRVGECEHRQVTPLSASLDNHWCGRDTLPGSRFCTRHQG